MRSDYRTNAAISMREVNRKCGLATSALVFSGIPPSEITMTGDVEPPKMAIFRILAGSKSYEVSVNASGKPESVFVVSWRADGIKAYMRKRIWQTEDGAPSLAVANVIRMAEQAASRKARQEAKPVRH